MGILLSCCSASVFLKRIYEKLRLTWEVNHEENESDLWYYQLVNDLPSFLNFSSLVNCITLDSFPRFFSSADLGSFSVMCPNCVANFLTACLCLWEAFQMNDTEYKQVTGNMKYVREHVNNPELKNIRGINMRLTQLDSMLHNKAR